MDNKELNNESIQNNNSVQPQQANFSQIFNVESEEQQPQPVTEQVEEQAPRKHISAAFNGNEEVLYTIEEEKEKVKANVLGILKSKYGFEEEDFLSAEIEAVPAGPARDFGLDRSMIMGYGHDDRVCAYTSLAAMLEVENPDKTCVCLLVDKEEIGSVGATGMQSKFFENTVAAAEDAGLSVGIALSCDDVDTPEDLWNLTKTMDPGSHTAHYLKQEGICI